MFPAPASNKALRTSSAFSAIVYVTNLRMKFCFGISILVFTSPRALQNILLTPSLSSAV
jgi:hypothetical protein